MTQKQNENTGCGYQQTGSLISGLVNVGAIGMGKKRDLKFTLEESNGIHYILVSQFIFYPQIVANTF